MKTPREILLARHQGAQPQLDDIRRAVVADLKPNPPREPGVPFLLKLWRELIWPCRRTWAGLAAAWLAILVFNHSQSESTPVASAQLHTPPAEIRLALREQHRVLEEILGIRAPAISVERVRRPNNQPRTERRSALTA